MTRVLWVIGAFAALCFGPAIVLLIPGEQPTWFAASVGAIGGFAFSRCVWKAIHFEDDR